MMLKLLVVVPLVAGGGATPVALGALPVGLGLPRS
jgi:hypothetical protein